MLRKSILIGVVLFVLIGSPHSFGQVCGDATGDGKANIGDLVYILMYIADSHAPGPVDSASVEMDDRIGITISDLQAMVDYLFLGAPLSCGATHMYGFALSDADTVFMPRMVNIPEGIDNVDLPVIFSFDPTTDAFYLPLLNLTPGSDTVFVLDSAHSHAAAGIDGTAIELTDTTILVGMEVYPTYPIMRNGQSFTLSYSRVGGGMGYIAPELVDNNITLKWSVEKNGDLYRPVVVQYDVEIPPDTLIVSESSLSFATVAGIPVTDSFYIDFTSSSMPIEFSLTASDPWITLDVPLSPTMIGTPNTVMVTVDADLMGVGEYTGTINIILQDPSIPSTAEQIDIELTILDPTVYPAGDFNCDGVVDIGDLTRLILYLFIDGPPLEYCN